MDLNVPIWLISSYFEPMKYKNHIDEIHMKYDINLIEYIILNITEI